MATSIPKAHEELLEGITPAIDDANFELMTESSECGKQSDPKRGGRVASPFARSASRSQLRVELNRRFTGYESVRLQPLRETMTRPAERSKPTSKRLPIPNCGKTYTGSTTGSPPWRARMGSLPYARRITAAAGGTAICGNASRGHQAQAWGRQPRCATRQRRGGRFALSAAQIHSGRILPIALSITALIAAGLIAWLYVGRNIVSRLARLSGECWPLGRSRESAVPVTGADEIGAMGRAVRSKFRRNAVELDQLLAERADAAIKLEKIVEQRTAELQRRGERCASRSKTWNTACSYSIAG